MEVINSTGLKVGKALSVLCKRNNINATELSRRTKVPVSTINNIIHGKTKNAGIVTINKLCQGLGIGLAEFFELAESELE